MNGQIIVGWTDSPEGHSALDWAVHQALLTNRSVVVVHEMLQDSLGGGAGEQGGSRMLVKEKSKVDAAVHAVAERFRDLDLQIAVEVDAPSAGLLRWSSAADVLVVGAPSRLHPRMLGSLPEHLAAAAESPVAWIPAGWQPSSNTNRTVVVGAMPTPAGRAAVRFAASEAIRMSAVLIAVVGSSRLSADGQAMLAHFDELAIAEPELTIEVDWIDADPAEALVGLSRRSQLLVVGTHHSSDRWSIRLGPITEEVLRRAHCPVITVARVHVSAAPTIVEPGKSSV